MVKTISRSPDYSDLDLDFIAHPTTGDVVKKTGIDAIKRSIRNLIFTNFYDRPFRSYIGSNAQKMLFDNINPMTATHLKNSIMETIINHEPRARLYDEGNDGVLVKIDPDNNGYVVSITFTEVSRSQPVNISFILERIR